ncbi:MAG: serine/threonine-protein kinase [Myxococcota bacterium]
MISWPSDDEANQPGYMLGRYRLVSRIAVGGMAEIYLARSESIEGFEKFSVVKRILPQFARDENFLRMFLDEARLAATLEHPNIVAVYDIGEQSGEYFFTMEYVHGQSLREVMRAASVRRQWIPLEHSLGVVIAICSALHHAHDKMTNEGQPLGIVHRDVSPSNVLLTYDGGIKLTDFGIAKATTVSEHTAAGTLKGKIPYMSPEQCRAEALDRRSDICSLGVLLYELTVGRRPYQAANEVALLAVVARGNAPPPSSVWPAYPKDLERIVMNAMAADRNYRYPSARALQMDLEEFARVYRIPVSTARLAHYMENLFDAESRKWPTNPQIAPTASADGPTTTYDPRVMAQHERPPTAPSPSGTIANPNTLADIAAMDAALSRLTNSESTVEGATEGLGGESPPSADDSVAGVPRDPAWMRRKR